MIFLTTIVQLSPNNSITENFGYWVRRSDYAQHGEERHG